MNLVGKIFTVFIFVMGLVFMSFAVAVYATHKNWKDEVKREEASGGKPLGLEPALKNKERENAILEDEKIDLEADLEKERLAKAVALAAEEEKRVDVEKRYNDLKDKHEKLVFEEREFVAKLKAAHDTLESLRIEIKGDEDKGGKRPGLRKQVRQAETDRDAYFNEVVRLTDELHQAVTELKRLRARQLDLAAELAKALLVLRKFDLKPEPALYANEPPLVDGYVRAVTRDGVVEISIGSDDGLLKGHKLEVVRTTGGRATYVGRIEVVKTDPDMSACRIDPKYLKSPVRSGDGVFTRPRVQAQVPIKQPAKG